MIYVGGRWPTADTLRSLIGNHGRNTESIIYVQYGPPRPEDARPRGRATKIINAGIEDKYTQAQKLCQNGVGLPVSREPNTLIQQGCYMLLERRLQHRGGTDIRIYKPPVLRGDSYFVPYVHAAQEIRVWCMQGEVLAIYQKILASNAQPANYPFVKSHSNGWVFMLVPKQGWTREYGGKIIEIRKLAKTALDSCRLNFGAIDMGLGLTCPVLLEHYLLNPEMVVFEVNSAPGVSSDRSVGLRKVAKRLKLYHDTYFLGQEYPYGADSANRRLDEEDVATSDDER